MLLGIVGPLNRGEPWSEELPLAFGLLGTIWAEGEQESKAMAGVRQQWWSVL